MVVLAGCFARVPLLLSRLRRMPNRDRETRQCPSPPDSVTGPGIGPAVFAPGGLCKLCDEKLSCFCLAWFFFPLSRCGNGLGEKELLFKLFPEDYHLTRDMPYLTMSRGHGPVQKWRESPKCDIKWHELQYITWIRLPDWPLKNFWVLEFTRMNLAHTEKWMYHRGQRKILLFGITQMQPIQRRSFPSPLALPQYLCQESDPHSERFQFGFRPH